MHLRSVLSLITTSPLLAVAAVVCAQSPQLQSLKTDSTAAAMLDRISGLSSINAVNDLVVTGTFSTPQDPVTETPFILRSRGRDWLLRVDGLRGTTITSVRAGAGEYIGANGKRVPLSHDLAEALEPHIIPTLDSWSAYKKNGYTVRRPSAGHTNSTSVPTFSITPLDRHGLGERTSDAVTVTTNDDGTQLQELRVNSRRGFNNPDTRVAQTFTYLGYSTLGSMPVATEVRQIEAGVLIRIFHIRSLTLNNGLTDDSFNAEKEAKR